MIKRLFDILFSIFGLVLLGWLIVIFWIAASIDTRSNGLFWQKRIGQFGKSFYIIKLKSMRGNNIKTISRFGDFIRRSKIDEWPQLINILVGDMSVVGPRPDVPGFYDRLQGEERKILELKPGLTSAASLKYFDEEYLLAQKEDPIMYNETVIFPDKIKMNLAYYYNHSFLGDMVLIWKTMIGKKGNRVMDNK